MTQPTRAALAFLMDVADAYGQDEAVALARHMAVKNIVELDGEAVLMAEEPAGSPKGKNYKQEVLT